MILAHASLYACAYAQWLASNAFASIVEFRPGTSENPVPVANAFSKAGTDDAGRPAATAALPTCEGYDLSFPLMIASNTCTLH